ncbi:type II secretion system protein [Bacillus dakarensis]|uniref:type II secretion system protein n=1 Tax=Robertmurraya dakarensis TaxID=1926278 RepID=UPI000981CB5A|nr:prepilin-type N-terminal cleavage/methylation domain-containing protein [Bacillus dakarensis]
MLKKLLNKKMKLLKNQQGLTLIELLVVIVILGIIAAVAIPMVMGQQDSAKKNTNAQNLSIMQDAVNRYYTINGADPTDIEDLTSTDKSGPFIKEIPKVNSIGTTCVPADTDDNDNKNGWKLTSTSGQVGTISINGTNTNDACVK